MGDTDILDLLYDASDVFGDDMVALCAAIKSMHRQTNIEHIINHIETQISLENYREAFIKIMGFPDDKIDYYKKLSKLDFKDASAIMQTLSSYFQGNAIDHSNLRRHQEVVHLTTIIDNAKELIRLIQVTQSKKKETKMNERQQTLF